MHRIIRLMATPASLALVALLCTATAAGQVNTEAMRRDIMEPGLHHRIGIDLEYQSGNSSFISIGAGYRLDLLDGPIYSFLISRYDRRSSEDVVNKNEGFAHLRVIYLLDSAFRPEVFAQKEFNDFILLRDRSLAGAGIRIRPLALHDSGAALTLFVGIGGMYETEQVAVTPEERTRLFRSTNYISLQARIGTALTTTLTGYYQIAPARGDDFRVLAEGELSLRLADWLSFVISSRYRYDNLPPAGVVDYDFRVKNGIALSF